ncbi:MAG: hypothetical protein LIP23_06000 [Planctomycetes bacterium]|nr:hypothetical protein [Planctomycetota bacterium]
MRKLAIALALILGLGLIVGAAGCGKVGGPRFWWDDRSQTRLPDEYSLPDDPAAPSDPQQDRPAAASGEDLSDENLRDYRTDLDLEEERRKSESSLFDF